MGLTRDELEAARGRSVADLVGDDVRLLFVGINPGLWTAASGAHFAHPGNRFYRALHAAGLVNELLDVRYGFDARSASALTDRGIAITNLVDRATARASELTHEELRSGAETVERKAAGWRPRVVAVVGIGAYRTAFGRPRAEVGPQDHDLGGAAVYALPNPSGLNAHYRLEDLARLYREAGVAAELDLTPPRGP